jgi:hypothetical protein
MQGDGGRRNSRKMEAGGVAGRWRQEVKQEDGGRRKSRKIEAGGGA